MTTRIVHAGQEIVILDDGQTIAHQCSPGDIAIISEDSKYFVCFVGADGGIDSWNEPYDTAIEAIEAIKNV